MQTSKSIALVVASGQGKKLNVLGHSVSVKLAKHETQGNHYVFELITPPGMGIPKHVHDREDELIYVVEGEFRITLGDENFNAGAGDEVYFPKHIPHAFQNVGSKSGKTLWTVVPGGNFEEFFEQLSALPMGEPDLAHVAKIFADYGMTILGG
ncbi:MAG: cupin domain-containing protein [Saprospiraceae bacterium]|jgi:quercetin dioxygenase-like cupin family protein|nr:cupin domain-containing protein [Saprospiraceae bacterium]MBL0024283.1 cupin domain-containing protein [Saprospiraceae bacterium]